MRLDIDEPRLYQYIVGREGDLEAEAEANALNTNDGVNRSSPEITEANDESGTSGPGPVPLRGIQGFTNQENVRPRNPPSSTNRLPNGKLGARHYYEVNEVLS